MEKENLSKYDLSLRKLSENVKKAVNDPELRKRLDEQKKLTPSEIQELIKNCTTKWILISDLSNYTRKSNRDLIGQCPNGHQILVSIQDILANVRCKTCHPKRTGSLNSAYKPFSTFVKDIYEKFGEDSFSFILEDYQGYYKPLKFRCNSCNHVFDKTPRSFLKQKHGCPSCARRATTDAQHRTKETFLSLVEKIHGKERFIFHDTPDCNFTNNSKITRTCLKCNTTREQSVQSLLKGNSCPVCSQRIKHTTESFIETAKKIWGDEFDYSKVNYVNNKHPVKIRCKKGHEFLCSPSNHFGKRGCPDCAIKKFVSAGETEWLDSLRIPNENRNIWLKINGQKINVDAFINGTVYEYYGDYWHGNLQRFSPDIVNHLSGLTMQEHFDYTIAREEIIRTAGYIIISMWENDWIELRKTRRMF